MKELSPGVNWDKVVEDYDLEQLEYWMGRLDEVKNGGKVHIDEVREVIVQSNKYIKATCIDLETGKYDEDLFLGNEVHLHIQGKQFKIVQGREFDPETGGWKE